MLLSRGSRQHAGRSVSEFNAPASSTFTDYIKNTEMIVNDTDSSLNDQEVQACSESSSKTSESTDNDDYSDSFISSSLETHSDIAVKPENYTVGHSFSIIDVKLQSYSVFSLLK